MQEDQRTAAPVAGRWRLSSWRALNPAGEVVGHPFGPHAAGMLLYTPGGWMAGQLLAGGRSGWSGTDPFGVPESERAAAYSSYVAYHGRYEIDGDRIVHHVQGSLYPGWAGQDLIRSFTLVADSLVLRTEAVEVAGVTTVHELSWIREESW